MFGSVTSYVANVLGIQLAESNNAKDKKVCANGDAEARSVIDATWQSSTGGIYSTDDVYIAPDNGRTCKHTIKWDSKNRPIDTSDSCVIMSKAEKKAFLRGIGGFEYARNQNGSSFYKLKLTDFLSRDMSYAVKSKYLLYVNGNPKDTYEFKVTSTPFELTNYNTFALTGTERYMKDSEYTIAGFTPYFNTVSFTARGGTMVDVTPKSKVKLYRYETPSIQSVKKLPRL